MYMRCLVFLNNFLPIALAFSVAMALAFVQKSTLLI